jgi:HAD superfamily hydrolase (TIGR01662 family)
VLPKLAELLAAGKKRVVLDNTYPTRVSRAGVIRTAHAHGVPVRCRYLATSLADAHFNVAMRQLEKYGRLLGPDEMKTLAKTDPNLPPPVALARWAASFEPPAVDEGFAAVETIPFVRRVDPKHTGKGLLLDVDGTLRRTKSGELFPRSADDVEMIPGRRDILRLWLDAGYRLFLVSNQSGIASGKLTRAEADAAFARTVKLLDLEVTEIAYCPHPSFPVGCYCRKPMPGLAALLMRRHGLAREGLVMVGDMESDAAFAANLGIRYVDQAIFFGLGGPSPGAD